MNRTFGAGKALFVGDWESLAMVHLEITAEELQPSIPFELDLFEGKAYVSLVFFTMRRMRLARGPRILNWFLYPFREQRFLNVRTYVRHNRERGIHFIREWISDRVCAHLGPLLYSLPYRYGKHDFRLSGQEFAAHVSDRATGTCIQCHFRFTEPLHGCEPGTRGEFFYERYAAFNACGGKAKSFRVSHEPWQQCGAEPIVIDDSLLRPHFPWFANARIAGANYSPGLRDVRMSRPIKVPISPAPLRPARLAA
jgi:uncharacterized protein YqjF (DUF2071 family)